MQFVDSILFRHVTPSEFANIEEVKRPSRGGGQSYIDLSGVDKSSVREFFDHTSATIDHSSSKIDPNGEQWPGFSVPITPLGAREKDLVQFDVRSGDNGFYRNYRITNQWIRQKRHSAWLPEAGFPTIIGADFQAGGNYDRSLLDQAIGRLFSRLCVFIIRTKLGNFYSGFVLGDSMPETWPKNVGLEEIVESARGSGVIKPVKLLELHAGSITRPFVVSAVDSYSEEDYFAEVFMTEEKYHQITALLSRKKNIILQGSPGTGKTFAAKRIAYSLMGAKDDSCICSVQFHQSSSYEDYIVGYRPDNRGEFKPTAGIFTRFFSEASDHPDENFYVIIDEINRANISKVFGELLMAIEADHRGERLELPVGEGMRISVPENVYVIGMMNTADRGLALIDYALRRRFAFIEMRPALDVPAFSSYVHRTGSSELESLLESVSHLNGEIEVDPSLGPGFMIGHSYFCLPEPITSKVVHSVIQFELAPLVYEYWFDQPQVAAANLDLLYNSIGPADEND